MTNEVLNELERQQLQQILGNELLALELMEEKMKLLEMELEIPTCESKNGTLCVESSSTLPHAWSN